MSNAVALQSLRIGWLVNEIRDVGEEERQLIRKTIQRMGATTLDEVRRRVDEILDTNIRDAINRILRTTPSAEEANNWVCRPKNEKLLDINLNGCIPIILTAPHGGVSPLGNVKSRSKKTMFFRKIGDRNTADLTRMTSSILLNSYNITPFFVVANVHRQYVDLNRPMSTGCEEDAARFFHQVYHSGIATAVQLAKQLSQRHPSGIRPLLLDIHGHGKQTNAVYRGSQNMKTFVPHACKCGHPLLQSLLLDGLEIHPIDNECGEKSGFKGGWTVRSYGLTDTCGDGIDAVQLEFAATYRKDKKSIAATATVLAAAIAKHVGVHKRLGTHHMVHDAKVEPITGLRVFEPPSRFSYFKCVDLLYLAPVKKHNSAGGKRDRIIWLRPSRLGLSDYSGGTLRYVRLENLKVLYIQVAGKGVSEEMMGITMDGNDAFALKLSFKKKGAVSEFVEAIRQCCQTQNIPIPKVLKVPENGKSVAEDGVHARVPNESCTKPSNFVSPPSVIKEHTSRVKRGNPPPKVPPGGRSLSQPPDPASQSGLVIQGSPDGEKRDGRDTPIATVDAQLAQQQIADLEDHYKSENEKLQLRLLQQEKLQMQVKNDHDDAIKRLSAKLDLNSTPTSPTGYPPGGFGNTTPNRLSARPPPLEGIHDPSPTYTDHYRVVKDKVDFRLCEATCADGMGSPVGYDRPASPSSPTELVTAPGKQNSEWVMKSMNDALELEISDLSQRNHQFRQQLMQEKETRHKNELLLQEQMAALTKRLDQQQRIITMYEQRDNLRDKISVRGSSPMTPSGSVRSPSSFVGAVPTHSTTTYNFSPQEPDSSFHSNYQTSTPDISATIHSPHSYAQQQQPINSRLLNLI